MNWMGGARKRLLKKSEERKRQELFFARHAASAPRPTSFDGSRSSGAKMSFPQNRRGISSSTDDEIFSYSATDKIYIENASLTDNEKKSFHKSSKILPSGFKFSSLHAPYSQFVIKMGLGSTSVKDNLPHTKNSALKSIIHDDPDSLILGNTTFETNIKSTTTEMNKYEKKIITNLMQVTNEINKSNIKSTPQLNSVNSVNSVSSQLIDRKSSHSANISICSKVQQLNHESSIHSNMSNHQSKNAKSNTYHHQSKNGNHQPKNAKSNTYHHQSKNGNHQSKNAKSNTYQDEKRSPRKSGDKNGAVLKDGFKVPNSYVRIKHHKKYLDALQGAPRRRKILTLSPSCFRGPLWQPMTPLKSTQKLATPFPKDNVENHDGYCKIPTLNTLKEENRKKSSVNREINTTWEKERLQELLGKIIPPPKSNRKE